MSEPHLVSLRIAVMSGRRYRCWGVTDVTMKQEPGPWIDHATKRLEGFHVTSLVSDCWEIEVQTVTVTRRSLETAVREVVVSMNTDADRFFRFGAVKGDPVVFFFRKLAEHLGLEEP